MAFWSTLFHKTDAKEASQKTLDAIKNGLVQIQVVLGNASTENTIIHDVENLKEGKFDKTGGKFSGSVDMGYHPICHLTYDGVSDTCAVPANWVNNKADLLERRMSEYTDDQVERVRESMDRAIDRNTQGLESVEQGLLTARRTSQSELQALGRTLRSDLQNTEQSWRSNLMTSEQTLRSDLQTAEEALRSEQQTSERTLTSERQASERLLERRLTEYTDDQVGIVGGSTQRAIDVNRQGLEAVEQALVTARRASQTELGALEGTLTTDLRAVEQTLRSNLMTLEQTLQSELNTVEETLRSEQQTSEEALRSERQASEQSLASEQQASERRSHEYTNTKTTEALQQLELRRSELASSISSQVQLLEQRMSLAGNDPLHRLPWVKRDAVVYAMFDLHRFTDPRRIYLWEHDLTNRGNQFHDETGKAFTLGVGSGNVTFKQYKDRSQKSYILNDSLRDEEVSPYYFVHDTSFDEGLGDNDEVALVCAMQLQMRKDNIGIMAVGQNTDLGGYFGFSLGNQGFAMSAPPDMFKTIDSSHSEYPALLTKLGRAFDPYPTLAILDQLNGMFVVGVYTKNSSGLASVYMNGILIDSMQNSGRIARLQNSRTILAPSHCQLFAALRFKRALSQLEIRDITDLLFEYFGKF